MKPLQPIERIAITHLFRELDTLLIGCLQSLKQNDWNRSTIARQWTIKDVAAHLLDGNIRSVSMLGDHYFGVSAPQDHAYPSMVQFLNELNASWVTAFKRVSPEMLIRLHQQTGPLYCALIEGMDPEAIASFDVNWAGPGPHKNWLHIAREYTEKWIHQQQIRHAIGDNTLYQHKWYYPCLSILMLGMPYACRHLNKPGQQSLHIKVTGDGGGDWWMVYHKTEWILVQNFTGATDCRIVIPGELAWQFFSKSLRPENFLSELDIRGDRALGMAALQTVSVMA